MTTVATCPIPNCTEPLVGDKPMCVHHWRSVPLVRQFEFYRASATLKKVKRECKRQAATDKYWRARAEVIAIVSHTQEQGK